MLIQCFTGTFYPYNPYKATDTLLYITIASHPASALVRPIPRHTAPHKGPVAHAAQATAWPDRFLPQPQEPASGRSILDSEHPPSPRRTEEAPHPFPNQPDPFIRKAKTPQAGVF